MTQRGVRWRVIQMKEFVRFRFSRVSLFFAIILYTDDSMMLKLSDAVRFRTEISLYFQSSTSTFAAGAAMTRSSRKAHNHKGAFSLV
jgi:hypothetical protein